MRSERFRKPIHVLSLHDVIILTKPEMPTARNKAAKVGSGLISIIVPVLNEAASIERFLRCLRERAGDAEVIVVDGGSRPEVLGGFFRIRIPSERFVYRLTDLFAHYAGLLLRTRFGDHGFFCRRTAFEEIGGFSEVPLMEDAEFFRKLRRLGRVAIIPSRLISSPRRYEEIGPWRLTLTYGLIALLYLLRVPIPALATIYQKRCARPDRLIGV